MSEFNEANLLELTEMLGKASENVERVYGAGYAVGHRDGEDAGGYTAGYNAGKQAEYDAFWDAIQDYGKRTSYSLGLCGDHWTKETFKPKYPIIMHGSGANSFAYWGTCGIAKDIDLRESCIIDTSNATNLASMFYNNKAVIGIGTLDCSNASSVVQLFNGAINLVTIEKIILGVPNSGFGDMFKNCASLENIAFDGEIRSDIDFQWSTKLSKGSILSIADHLSATTSGKTLTLSKAAVDEALKVLPPDGVDDPPIIGSEGGAWLEIMDTHPNWTITLI